MIHGPNTGAIKDNLEHLIIDATSPNREFSPVQSHKPVSNQLKLAYTKLRLLGRLCVSKYRHQPDMYTLSQRFNATVLRRSLQGFGPENHLDSILKDLLIEMPHPKVKMGSIFTNDYSERPSSSGVFICELSRKKTDFRYLAPILIYRRNRRMVLQETTILFGYQPGKQTQKSKGLPKATRFDSTNMHTTGHTST